MRELDIARDLTGLGELIAVSFSGELARRGEDIQDELRSLRPLIPVVRTLGRVSEEFRHLFDGFVWEAGGRVVGSVTVQRMGSDGARWYIGAVAVHPDWRRQGIARRLVSQAIEHARRHGATVCLLDVRADNVPAYSLYRSLGFVKFDGACELKLEATARPGLRSPDLPPAYRLRPWGLGEWRVSYHLALAETPREVQEFLPLREEDYRCTPLRRLTLSLLTRLQGIAPHRFLVEYEGKPVAAARLLARRRDRGVHELRLWFHPAHREVLAEPVLTYALLLLSRHPRRNLLVRVPARSRDLVQLLKGYGFVEIERTHRLGLKLDGRA